MEIKTVELTAEMVKAANDLKPEPVDIPEWGGRGYVRRLDEEELNNILTHESNRGGATEMRTIVATCLCDKDGNRLFPDVTSFPKKGFCAMRRVYDAACAANGIGKDAVENAEGKSETTPD